MPFVHIAWLPKACRTAKVRKEIADAVIKVMAAHPEADISPDNLVVRFSESVDGFPLPKGHSHNPELAAPQKPEAEAFLKDR
jgi:phenylpyruvate tautomerase PptA (4-oxalocrotonate tautomerase family)